MYNSIAFESYTDCPGSNETSSQMDPNDQTWPRMLYPRSSRELLLIFADFSYAGSRG